MEKKEITVSVIVATYNQEKYIAKTLESAVCQKADFNYEIIVGDDASRDGTASLVKSFADQYPDKIVPVLRKRNLGMALNTLDLYKRARGKYIAFLEGDDYWLDDEKLLKQVEFLDRNIDYVACFGKIIIVDENNIRQADYERDCRFADFGEYTIKDFNNYLLPGQTATGMYRKTALDNLFLMMKKVRPRIPLSDMVLVLGTLSQGRIYTHPDLLAAYRYILKKESKSWSSKNDFFSVRNSLIYLIGMGEMERIAGILGMKLDFDERRKLEFSKVADYKGKINIFLINIMRFAIWASFNDKEEFRRFMAERHKKPLSNPKK